MSIKLNINPEEIYLNNKINNYEKYFLEQTKKFNNNYEMIEVGKKIISCYKVNKNIDNDYDVNQETLTGLLVGEVQSGKTNNFLSLSCVAFDNDVDIIVVFTGSNTSLNEQTGKRIKKFFKETEKYNELEQVNIYSSLEYSLKKNRESDLTLRKLRIKNSKSIMVVMKNEKHLSKTKQILENLDKRILFIDDEGDQASLNSEETKKDNDNINTFTKINQLIEKMLLELFRKSSDNNKEPMYITVTATPYNNLFLRDVKSLKPRFTVVASKDNNKYWGLQKFHGNRENNFIEVFEKNNDNIDNYEQPLLDFLVGNYLLNSKKQINEKKNYQMLIYVKWKSKNKMKNKLSTHENVREKIKNYLNKFCEIYEGNNINDRRNMNGDIHNSLLRLWRINDNSLVEENQIDELIDKISKHIVNIWKREELYDGEEPEFEEFINIKIINADEKDNNQESNNQGKFVNYDIIIGSNLVERGVTFDNLRVCTMTFVSKKNQADVALQRCRWFGYRNPINNLTKIYLPREQKNYYYDLCEFQSNLLDFLWFIDPDDFIEKKKLIQLPEKEINLMSGNKNISFRMFNKFKYSQNSLENIENDGEKDLLDEINMLENEEVLDVYSMVEYTKRIKITREWINKLLPIFKKVNFPNKNLFEKLNSQQINNIVFVKINKNGEPRTRKYNHKHKFTLLSGYEKNKKNDNESTPGDADLLNRYNKETNTNDSIMIQLHEIVFKARDNSVEDLTYKIGNDPFIAFSLIFPEDKDIKTYETK